MYTRQNSCNLRQFKKIVQRVNSESMVRRKQKQVLVKDQDDGQTCFGATRAAT